MEMSPTSPAEGVDDCPSGNSDNLAPHMATLGDVFAETDKMLDSASNLMMEHSPNQVLPGDGELTGICESLRAACDEARPLIGGGKRCHGDAPMVAMAPRLLVLGQPKCGKSSFINEILGKTIVRQSESPWAAPAELTRLRHSEKSHTLRYFQSNDGELIVESEQKQEPSDSSDSKEAASTPTGESNSPTKLEETAKPVVEFGLPIELLRRAGVEIVDSPGSHDSPPVDAWSLAASPAIVVYVIDAVYGITREVEEDIRQLQHRFASSQLIFVLNKMDVATEVAVAADVTADEASAGMRHRVLAKLRELGCLSSEQDGEAGDEGSFLCLSCRRLRAMRKGGGDSGGGTDDKDASEWIESLARLRSNILGGVARRLGRLVAKASDGLESAAQTFGSHAGRAEDLKECKEVAWENILGLEKRVMRDVNDSRSNSLIDRMLDLISERKNDILEAVKVMEQTANDQTSAEAEIERLVFDMQVEYCQECSDAELTTRLRRMDDVIAALASYQEPLTPAPIPDMDRKFSIKDGLDFDKLERSPSKQSVGKELMRSFGRSKATWKIEVAKKFMRSTDMKLVLKPSIERLEALIHRAHIATQKAVGQANARVNELRSVLKARSYCYREQRRACLKLWLRLQSVLTENQFVGFQWQRKACIAVGVQGSAVYKVVEEHPRDSGVGRAAMAVKKFVLSDEQLDAMAASLHYNCTTTRDFVLRIERLELKKLSDEPKLWQLRLWTEMMQHGSLQQQLPRLCQEATTLSDKLQIGLSIADALTKMHSDRQQHANLRLSNIFICNNNFKTVKLSDIGQARTTPLTFNCNDGSGGTIHGLFPPELLVPQQISVGGGTVTGKDTTLDASSRVGVDAFCLGAILKLLGLECQVQDGVQQEINKIIDDCSRHCPAERPPVSDVAERLRQLSAGSLGQNQPTGD